MPVTINGSGPIAGVTSINTTVTDTELGYLDGVSSALQTQINTKAADSSQGLYLITPTSIANSGGSASASGGAVTFTGVTSVSLNGVFTSTYDNYCIVIANTASAANLLMRLRSSGTDNTTSDYSHGIYQYTSANVAQAAVVGSATSSWTVSCFATNQGMTLDIYSPYLSAHTTAAGMGSYSYSSTPYASSQMLGAGFKATTSFDGFSLYVASGTATGIVRVYGYKNS